MAASVVSPRCAGRWVVDRPTYGSPSRGAGQNRPKLSDTSHDLRGRSRRVAGRHIAIRGRSLLAIGYRAVPISRWSLPGCATLTIAACFAHAATSQPTMVRVRRCSVRRVLNRNRRFQGFRQAVRKRGALKSRLSTFLCRRRGRRRLRIVVCFRFTGTFDVDLFCFSKLSTVLTLRHWASFLFNFNKRAIAVFACR